MRKILTGIYILAVIAATIGMTGLLSGRYLTGDVVYAASTSPMPNPSPSGAPTCSMCPDMSRPTYDIYEVESVWDHNDGVIYEDAKQVTVYVEITDMCGLSYVSAQGLTWHGVWYRKYDNYTQPPTFIGWGRHVGHIGGESGSSYLNGGVGTRYSEPVFEHFTCDQCETAGCNTSPVKLVNLEFTTRPLHPTDTELIQISAVDCNGNCDYPEEEGGLTSPYHSLKEFPVIGRIMVYHTPEGEIEIEYNGPYWGSESRCDGR